MMDDYTIKEIQRIVSDCEDVQNSTTSKYTKEREKVYAYDQIARLVMGDKEE